MQRFIFIATSLFVTQMVLSQPGKMEDKINATRELRALMQLDPHRPIYHFVSPEGRAAPFDPNGGIYWNGKYHLGYIYQQQNNNEVTHVWGHAVSTDLFHWTIYPDMLDVKRGDMERGIFSGGAFLSREGIPHVIYHGEGSSTNLIACSKDPDLKNWVKFEGNPVCVTPSKDDPLNGKYKAWDPEAWYDKKSDTYYQISGGNPNGFFKSKDMYHWEYLGEFVDSLNRKNYPYEDISCPDFFRIDDKDILLFLGHYHGAQYYIGTFANDKYTVEKHGRMNWPGGTFFAPEQLVDNKGRNIVWGWIRERKSGYFPDYGWSGIMSLPRVLTLSKGNELLINPPEEIKNIRLNSLKEADIVLKPNTEQKLQSRGKSIEIQMEIEGGQKSPYGLKVFCSPDGREETIIKYDPVAKEIVIDFIKSSVHAPVKMIKYCFMHGFPEENAHGEVSEQRAPFTLELREKLKLDVFLDRSVIEVFVNGRQCVTQVVYPILPESNEIRVFSGNDPVSIKNIRIWEMAETNFF